MPRYFGVGLSKTGTKSLYSTFMMLGYEPVVHMASPEDWARIDEFEFANDHPMTTRFEELDQRFPDAKFIYTVRDMDSWLDSCRRHWERFRPVRSQFPQWVNDYNIAAYGVPDYEREAFRKAYLAHEEWVMDYFHGREDFLVMNIVAGDGWNKLLPFLDLSETRFPHHR